jgi:hypothetical protein
MLFSIITKTATLNRIFTKAQTRAKAGNLSPEIFLKEVPFMILPKIISIKIFFLPVLNLDVSSVKMAVRTGIS